MVEPAVGRMAGAVDHGCRVGSDASPPPHRSTQGELREILRSVRRARRSRTRLHAHHAHRCACRCDRTCCEDGSHRNAASWLLHRRRRSADSTCTLELVRRNPHTMDSHKRSRMGAHAQDRWPIARRIRTTDGSRRVHRPRAGDRGARYCSGGDGRFSFLLLVPGLEDRSVKAPSAGLSRDREETSFATAHHHIRTGRRFVERRDDMG